MANTQHKKRPVKVGVRDLVFALLTEDTSAATTYATDMHLVPGAMDIALTVSLSDEALGADDNPTWELLSTLDALDVALQVGSLGKEVQALVMGQTIDDNGILLQASNDAAPWVAMGFKSARTDGTDELVWLYKGKFKPSDSTFHTKERGTVNWNTPTINATFGPRDSDKRIMATGSQGDEDVTEETVSAFFASVYKPVVTTTEP